MTENTLKDLVDCELFVAMNEDGGWVVTNYESDALTKLGEDEGGYNARVVKVTVKIRPPETIDAGTITAPDEAGTTVPLPEVG